MAITIDETSKEIVETPEQTETPAPEPEKTETSPTPTVESLQATIKDLERQRDTAAAAARRKAEGELKTVKAELEAAKRRLDAGVRPLPPDPASFTNEDGAIDRTKYQQAMVSYEDKLHTWRQAQTPASPPPEDRPAETPETMANTFLERAAPLRQKHAGFDQVVNTPVFTPDMRDTIFDSEQGPEIAYFLGKNPAEANRIAALPAAQMLREIGRLEARFSAPAQRAVSAAPPPITPVTGTAGAPKDPEKMNTAEWMEWNRQQEIERLKKQPL